MLSIENFIRILDLPLMELETSWMNIWDILRYNTDTIQRGNSASILGTAPSSEGLEEIFDYFGHTRTK